MLQAAAALEALLHSSFFCLLKWPSAEVQLVTGDDYAPLTGKSLAGAGVLSEVVQAAFAQSGMPSSLAWQPWKRGYLMTHRGEYDATFP